MQYTIRGIPAAVDRALRRKAREDGRSLNDVALEALRHGVGIDAETPRYRRLRDLAGSWVEDRAIDAALAEQDRIDEALWK